jgi:hypothetical protein
MSKEVLLRVDTLGDKDSAIGKVVVVERSKRIVGVMDAIIGSGYAPKFVTEHVPAKIIGGRESIYKVLTDRGFLRAPIETDRFDRQYAVKFKDGSVMLVAADELVMVYDESVWGSDSEPSGSQKPKAKRAAKEGSVPKTT